ncbi:glucagon receptor-like isoform X3 [Agelaius tricolor]|uniref:glucagon receptor-like isoform X3 n=1 Tax=Agelaius tricolor TaxID=9191 RepID=UPI0039F1B92D
MQLGTLSGAGPGPQSLSQCDSSRDPKGAGPGPPSPCDPREVPCWTPRVPPGTRSPGRRCRPRAPPEAPPEPPPVVAQRWQEAAPPQTPLGHRRVHLAEPGLPETPGTAGTTGTTGHREYREQREQRDTGNSGNSGNNGNNGNNGTPGTTGTAGTAGTAGTTGTAGTAGTRGLPETPALPRLPGTREQRDTGSSGTPGLPVPRSRDRRSRPSLRRAPALGAAVRLGAAMRDSPGAGSLRSLVQLAWLCLFSSVPHGGAKVLEKTFEEWLRYRDECLRRMASEPYPAGLFCNRTFDMYACWPDGSPGTAVNVSCPFYLPWFEKVKHGLVSRRCGTDGQWVTVNGSQPWRDYSQCEDELEVTAEEEGARRLMVSFKVLYTVGYSLSLLTLISALLVLTACRNLRCTRNYIHANLFASFGLRATSVMVKDALLERRWGVELVQVADWEALLSHEATLGCRAAQVLMQYCILANHYWFLVEAVYLYKLLIGAVFSEKNYYRLYLYLGWGTPVVFVVPWMAAKYLKENAECWALNENMAYWWIIRIPILLASLINLLIFMRILKVILAKLRANQKGYADYKLRLAKATLTLIPLFGIHEVVFIFATDEQTTGILRYIKVFFTLFLNSFQGFLVAVLYCFANKEVKSEMKKKWQLWKLDHPVLCCAQ